jgi:hypothetical protein
VSVGEETVKLGFAGGLGAAVAPASPDGAVADPHETPVLATAAASTARRVRERVTIAPPWADSAPRCNLG